MSNDKIPMTQEGYDKIKATLPAVVTLTRYSAGTLDDDNLRGALKAVRDGIADALGVPDNDPRIYFAYGQASSPRGSYAVHVRIEEHDDGQL